MRKKVTGFGRSDTHKDAQVVVENINHLKELPKLPTKGHRLQVNLLRYFLLSPEESANHCTVHCISERNFILRHT